MPIGVRTPVESMSMRFLIGMRPDVRDAGKAQLRVHLVLQLVEGDALGCDARRSQRSGAG